MDKRRKATTPPKTMARNIKPDALSEGRIRDKNIQKILTAAVEVFSRKGLDGTRIVEIAEASGLPKGTVYYYYSSKEEIYRAALESLIHGWDEAFDHISAEREPVEAIAAYVQAKLDNAREHAAETRFFANEILQGARHLGKQAREHMSKVTAEKALVIQRWAQAGKIAKVDAKHLFILLWSTTQFYVEFETLACDALQVKHLRPIDHANAAATITQIVLNGLVKK